MRVGVVTDSTADLPPDAVEQFGIQVVPLCITWDERTYLDRVELSTAEYYRRLRGSETLPTTGPPTPAAFIQAYQHQLARCDAVLSIHISAKFSATIDVARLAAREVDEDRVTLVDSGSFSVCLGWLAEAAARMGNEGRPPWEIASALKQMRARLRIYAALDTLEGLARGGRIGRARSLIGTLLQVKPIVLIKDGEVLPLTRARTTRAAHQQLLEQVLGHGPLERLGVVHGDAAEAAEWLIQQLRERAADLPLDTGEIGTVIGTHAGPGAVAIGVLLRE